MKTRRYQLKKEALGVVERGHPWIFRDQLSSAAQVFADGDCLRLVDGANKVVGFGIYEAEGAIAIRVLRRGAEAPNAAWLRRQLTTALARRLEASAAAPALSTRTDGIRLVHGESDGIPAVVVDRFGDTLVVQSYAKGADALARFAATAIARELAIPNVLLRPAHRRRAPAEPARVLRGTPPAIARFTEDGLAFAVGSRRWAEERHVPRSARPPAGDREAAAGRRARAEPVRVLRDARPRRRGRGMPHRSPRSTPRSARSRLPPRTT